MPWPLPSHFSAVLQTPRVAFRDPQMQTWRIERNALGQPRSWAGSFAVVYKAVDPNGHPHAVRVFSTESPQRRQRYEAMAAHLRAWKLASLVGFEYRDDAIRSAGDGKWYPLLLMDWVEGQTLFAWVRSKCRQGKGASLEKAARHWLALVAELAEARMAHGDLQHANVMVTPLGRLKLVDYDGMAVPALFGQRNLEVGVPPYQHPQRGGATLLSAELDRFSALLIYVALRALAADPQLWERYVEQPGYDKLVFRTDDFRDPSASALRRDLSGSPDPEVGALAERLFALAAGDMAAVPPLDEVVAACGADRGARGSRADGAVGGACAREPRAPRSAGEPRIVLDVTAGPMKGRAIVLDRHDTFLLGRGADCHAQLLDDPRVSRHHCILEANPPAVAIRDLGSRNGTYVNGVKHGGRAAGAQPGDTPADRYPVVDLADGDYLTVGRTSIRVRIEGGAPPQLPEDDGDDERDTGFRIAGYDLAERLGDGTLGEVYRAVRQADGQAVAVKLVPARMLPERGRREALLVQLRTAGRLRHPNIAALLDCGIAGQRFFFVSEFCPGGSLAEWLSRAGGRLPLATAGPLMIQCLEGLEYAHGHDVLHGDLKPQNILLDGNAAGEKGDSPHLPERPEGGHRRAALVGAQMGTVPFFSGQPVARIGDFGLARQFEMAGLTGMTATGGLGVNYYYAPRERLTSFTQRQFTSDLWSMAAVFYHVLSGQLPYDFQHRNPIAVILDEEPIPLARRCPDLPAALSDALDKALRSNPAERYATAAEMKAAIQHGLT